VGFESASISFACPLKSFGLVVEGDGDFSISLEPLVGGDFEFFEFCNDVIFGFANFDGLREFGCHFFFLGFFNVVMRAKRAKCVIAGVLGVL